MASPEADGSSAYLANLPFGFTTTPEQRSGPPPPYTNTALQVNLFFRVFLGTLSVIVTLIPTRLLWITGEFAGTVFCGAVVIRNTGYVINALIWRNDNVATWWAGYGWCDLQVYLNFALDTAFNISLFEIMRSLYTKVGLTRTTALTSKEKRRQQIISAVVIFTIPVIQVVLNFFLMIRRYNISTLVGCTTLWHFDWVFFTFYILPTPVFVTLAAVLAAFVFKRFRQIEKLNKETMQSYDTAMSARQNRVKRKLYFMTLAILVVVVPLILAFFILNIIDGWAYWSQPYDFNAIHYGPDPFNTYFISFTTSDLVRSVDMNLNYIPALTGFVTFFVFGTTTDSLNSYRRMLLFFGLGYIFPKLREEYRPADGRRSAGRSWLSSISRVFPTRGGRRSSNSGSSKRSILPTVEHVSQSSRNGNQSSRPVETPTSKSDTMCSGARQGLSSPPVVDTPNPWPDLSPHTTIADAPPAPPQPGQHNPWVLRTVLSPFPIKFPSRQRSGDISEGKPIRLPSLKKPSPTATEEANEKETPVATGTTTPQHTTPAPVPPALGVDTRVWAATPPATPAALPEQKMKESDGIVPVRQQRSDEHLDVVRIQTETRTTSFTVPPPSSGDHAADPSATTTTANQTAGRS
ncbi:hypothetical protein QBC39DRAFT_327678 [Podospora conica]|nr:hypothetical protein QBC39DRAFT_327678 [Schizothecium conicum]